MKSANHQPSKTRRNPKRARAALIFVGLAALAMAVTLALTALEDNLVFFRSPSDLAQSPAELGKRLRLGGLVKEGSVERNGLQVAFVVTDLAHDVRIEFSGALPDLFREGQGVVAEGSFVAADQFVADTVLAKHDENYMPPEVADALKKSGQWQGDGYAVQDSSDVQP